MSEAVSNAVEHAYPVVGFAGGVVTVDAEIFHSDGVHRARVRVRDDGWWRSRPGDVGPPQHLGLEVIALLMDEVTVRRGDIGTAGTEISMVSRPVAA